MPAAPAPEPQVKGRLADTEKSIIEVISRGSGERYRTSISIDAELALAGVRAAAREHRDSLSSLIDAALAQYSERYSPLPTQLEEFVAKLQQATAANPAILQKMEADLRRLSRTPAKPAA